MLEITVPASESFDYAKNEFVNTSETKLQLEHSLISISKWESKWEKPFLGKGEKTIEETVDYVRCMTLNSNVDPKVYHVLTNENVETVTKYINAKMTATWFNEHKEEGRARGNTNGEAITSELIYYWMIANNIPFECQKWHLNRLLTLIHVCGIKNQPEKKMSKRQTASTYAALNAARRKAHHTSG